MRSNRPILRLTDITKSFGGVDALRGVSMDLYPGEVHALLGENGAGKSTLIRVVTGAHSPDAGSIEIAGNRVDRLTPALAHRLGIVCIYQQPALFPALSVAENIGLRLEPPRAFHRVRMREWQRRSKELLERLGAGFSPCRLAGELSMPEQQLVEIACALGAGARIVIMDEPTSALTLREQQLLYRVVRELRNHGAGIIYISHRLEEIFELASRVTVLRDGQGVGTRTVGPQIESEEFPAQPLTESGLIQMMIGRDAPAKRSTAKPTALDGRPVLAVENLTCAASGVNGVSFAIRGGEILGLAGLVGAGRTGIARTLFGITPADSGVIRVAGNEVSIPSPAAAVQLGIAYVPEDRRQHGVILDMAIAANISMAVHARLFPKTWLRPSAESALAARFVRELGIKSGGHQAPAGSLSGGNQQKVALARWLAAEPRVLMLDEPTQGIDVGAKAEIHRIIRDLAGRGVAVLLISSDLPEILELSDRIAICRQGRIRAVLDGAVADPHAIMAVALGQPADAEAGVACGERPGFPPSQDRK